MVYNNKKRYSKRMKSIALTLLLSFAWQLVQPTVAMALTTGPSQPEMQGFEPVGTTDMVDMFSGAFVYNIPLLDVEGYPVNISYHGGVTMEQEASWVGLGWNINPGVINRTVRGIPDDFNGDSLSRDFHIKDEKTFRVGMGSGAELAGVGDPALKLDFSLGANLNISNYRGVSADFSFGGGINVLHCISTGVNLGVGSQTGASIDYNAGLALQSSQLMSKDMAGGVGVNVGTGYSTRSGVKDLNFSFSVSEPQKGKAVINSSASVPIGIKNYVPVITNSSTMSTIYGRIKLGGELFGGYGYGNISAMFSNLHYNNDATRSAYGYLYLQNANLNNSSILDFTRDKDGMFNKSMQYLPPSSLTYDIYSVSGQGTGGVFRPFRNDFGNVYDPFTTDTARSEGGEAEAAISPNLFETGLDYSHSGTEITSGPWLKYQRSGTTSKGFTSDTVGSTYESVFFKQAGELTVVDPAYYAAIGGLNPITPDAAMNLSRTKPGSHATRDARSNLVYYRTAKDDTGIGSKITSYNNDFTHFATPLTQNIPRIGTGSFQRKKDQVSEIIQVQRDGKKYVYGIPAMNNVQREATFSVDGNNSVNLASGTVTFGGSDATNGNGKGRDNYYNSTVTPSYAHGYLLTSVLSADYVDVTGDGVSDDDLGTFTKFNYTLTDNDYRWVAPYSSSFNIAQYNQGFWSDHGDDKGSFVCGSREQWILHSVETRNFIAEFYTCPRHDAHGITAAILNSSEASIYNRSKSSPSSSYELDSIKLYNKHDRFINTSNAVPVKTIFFMYDYSLCGGIPNSDASTGKLTLKRILFRYGNSQKSMISPYQFSYGPNPSHDIASKDRWGNYKPNSSSLTNYEYPYVNQNDTADNTYAASWALNSITLPSGGVIRANYESNDYAYVQNQPANEMFLLQGVGNSPAFLSTNLLYNDKNSPFLYAYFLRRQGSELPGLPFAQNYLGRSFQRNGNNCMYFNFNVQLTGAGDTYEQIKGYANISDAGICSNDSSYGYIKFTGVTPSGGGANLNPATYTALNTARYNLPQILFPGSNPAESDLNNILAGLKESFGELLNAGKNPLVELIGKHCARTINLGKSFIRLQSVGLRKKGGGQRVKSLYFYDQWNVLAGGNEQLAYYGKQYNYSVNDPTYGTISSGVASYEPLIGGDENPLRQPVRYTAQSGSSWPPSDPVDLYQETPVGESLFPPAQVGYSIVTVSSIHAGQGKSSQGLDKYEFYTAKDFPAQVKSTTINANSTNHYDFFSQQNLLTATQGYTLIFNDMHGKPKKVEHDIYNAVTQAMQVISYQLFNYRQTGGKLNNTVNCLVFDGTNMVQRNKQLGIEEDVTMDCRQKDEITHNSTLNGNLNFFIIEAVIPIPVPIPYSFTWTNDFQNQFQSAAVTKIVQQYGILDNVVSYNEGALTTMQNEVYDPNTGQPLVTSVTNEFHDKEYTTSIPAYWAYPGMAPGYSNISYKDTGNIYVRYDNIGTLHVSNPAPLVPGDQLSVYYTDTLHQKHNIVAWVLGNIPFHYGPHIYMCDTVDILPVFPLNTPGWLATTYLKKVSIEVIGSGHTNRLNETVENYTSMDFPVNPATGVLNTALTNLISLNAKVFADSNTMTSYDYLFRADTVNPFSIGQRGIWRVLNEYNYLTPRNYSGVNARNSGLFNATSLFSSSTLYVPPPVPSIRLACWHNPYSYIFPSFSDQNWHLNRAITKYSPNGKEIENVDAVGNYSSAIYGYNEELPVAVAYNARQGDVLSDGFEDYNLLQPKASILRQRYSPFNIFTTSSYAFLYNLLNLSPSGSSPSIASNIAHTGTHSLLLPSVSGATTFQVTVSSVSHPYYYSGLYNSYYSYLPYSAASEYLSFGFSPARKYILSFWMQPSSGVTSTTTDFGIPSGCSVSATIAGTTIPIATFARKSNIIDGWQQFQAIFNVPSTATDVRLILPASCYFDDFRIQPAEANMKSFVYNAINEKLIATLDENNFATMYEYDQEGNLVRQQKETAKGIMTVSESRSGNPKQ
jgi:YD repeat-containing protein